MISRNGWLAVVTSGFPRRSETFLLNELLALEDAGTLDLILATGPGDGSEPQPGFERLADRLCVLRAGTAQAQGAAAARLLAGRPARAIHGYFAHTPAAVAAVAAARLGLRFGFSVHARDARKVTAAELGRRARAAACVIACNRDAAGEVEQTGSAATLIPHGVDLDRFRPQPVESVPHLRLLAVGRLVEKKGFDVLIEALRGVELPVRLRIVGEGPLRKRLAGAIEDARLEGVVELVGPVTHDELPDEYAAADVVVAPSLTDASGDRDGLPNVVLEAMACGRPVIAGDTGAVSTGVVHGETGLLVSPAEAPALRAAVLELARSTCMRDDLGHRARKRAERYFDLGVCSRRFGHVLEAAYG